MSKEARIYWLLRLMPAAGFFLLMGVIGWQVLQTSSVDAAPHLLSRQDPCMDPDWPLVRMMLETKCLGCHRAGAEQADLSSYEKLRSAGQAEDYPVIVPGEPEESLLWEYVSWNSEADADSDLPDEPQMPEDRHEWLTTGQQQTIYRWIKNGARKYIRDPGKQGIQLVTEADFPSAKTCAACHPNQYEEWSRSMHAYAQHSPVFMAFNQTLQERTGGTLGTFCTRCHTPIGTYMGEDGLRDNVHRSQISMEGVTCVVCHRRRVGHHKSSGRVDIQPGDLLTTCMYGPFEDGKGKENGAHPAAKSPLMKQAQFCGECHDVTNPQGVRLEEAFSEWHNSPAAKNGQTCQHCHMGTNPGVPILDHQRPLGPAAIVPGVPAEKMPLRRLSSHTFTGPDYSLLPDTEFPEKLDWMYEKDYRDPSNLTPHQQRTLHELRIENRTQLLKADSLRYQLLRNAACISVEHAPTACSGGRAAVRVDVTSKTAGHSFPTGFTAERQLWIQIEVRDAYGKLVFVSGGLDSNGDLLDEHSHDVLTGKAKADPYLLNFQNKFTARANKGTERSVVLSVNRHIQPINVLRPATGISISFGRPDNFRIAKGSLPPLATMGQTYPVQFPGPGRYYVTTKLNFRHLPPTLLDHCGISELKHLLEIVTIDQKQTVIDVQP